MTQQIYRFFYRQVGIRYVQGLLVPKLSLLTTLPKDTMLHYLTDSEEIKDIDTSSLYLKNSNKRILVDYPEHLTSDKGSPRKVNVIIRGLTKKFHLENKQYKYIKDHYKVISDVTLLLINNYSYLYDIYKYVQLPMSDYYKWWNIQKTMWDNINTISDISNKNHFYFINLPTNLPSYSILNIYSIKTNITMLKIFDNNDKLFLLELWKWLSVEHRDKSIFANLTETAFSKITLVFNVKDGRSAYINLGYLNSWIKGNENTTEFSNIIQLTSVQIQRIFLKFLLTLQSNNVELIDDVELNESGISNEPTNDINAEVSSDQTTSGQYNEIADDTIGTNNIDLEKEISELDDEFNKLEKITNYTLMTKDIVIDKSGEEVQSENVKVAATKEELEQTLNVTKDTTEVLDEKLNKYVEQGLLTTSDYKSYKKDIEAFKNLENPYNSTQNYLQSTIIQPEELLMDDNVSKIPDSNLVLDKSMLNSSLLGLDRNYIANVMKKDILAMTSGIQKAGVVIKNHVIDTEHSILGSYEKHTLELKPLDGASSTIHFKIPIVALDGTLKIAGNRYSLRKQKVDIPIRKISTTIVALTSYYGKSFVSLCDKKANSSSDWLVTQINKALIEQNEHITKVTPASVYDNNFKAPYIYSVLANNFKIIIAGDITLVLDHRERKVMTDPDTLIKIEVNGNVLIGYTSKHEPVVIDKNNNFFIYANGVHSPIGNIYDVLELPEENSPIDFSEIKIFSKNIPVAMILGYSMGFANLITVLGAAFRTVEAGKRPVLEKHEYLLKFRDLTYIFSKKDKVASNILSGFLEYEKQIKVYDSKEFDHKNIYLNLLTSKGLSAIYLREIDLIEELFIDPITLGILKSMGEPTTFNGLLIRATEMLQTYNSPISQDMNFMRVRGYERISGAIYKELAVAVRQYRSKNIAGRSKIEISPFQVWNTIIKDPAMETVQDINPIQDLKRGEVVTYVGEGGRTKEAMNKASRAYHINDMGVVSEATVDSTDVGINAFFSADPNFNSLRGTIKKEKVMSPTNLFSTSALLAPGADHDNPARINFISIQQGHTIASDGYHQPYIRTGYESVINNRVSSMFATTALMDGKVINVEKNGILVEYSDGSKVGVELGRVHGTAEGSTYPYDIATQLHKGESFKKGDTIAYNTGFFEVDFLDRKKVIMKNSFSVKTAIFESNQTYEDSSSISRRISNKLSARTTKVKTITLEFNQEVLDVLKVGQKVTPEDIYMLIEDEITSNVNIFDKESLLALRRLSNQAPKVSYIGVVDKIEVFYHGEKDDMSKSLRALADDSDLVLKNKCLASGVPIITGEVNDDYRVNGVPLAIDKACVKFYITINTEARVGDKGVFGNQLKSVFAEVMDYDMHTESGEQIDAIFSYRAIAARIVLSPMIIGTTTTLLKLVAKKAVKMYKGS